MVADPLRLLEICATSDGGAALIVLTRWSTPSAQLGTTRCRVRGRVDGDADVPEHDHRDAQLRHRLSAVVAPAAERPFKDSISRAAYEEAGIGPEDLVLRRGLRPVDRARARLVRGHRPLQAEGEAERLLRDGDTTIGGRIPVNPQRRAGLLRRGRPGPGHRPGVRAHVAAPRPGHRPPGRGRPVGITANQGLFGHGSSVIVTR